ncbi:lipopolysaccharide biosynthesis protein [Desulfopila sp. IMCC35006]|uniref:lipopolysaccharide biosynthesis protein n=1 Tax=Desulfopila sp. IMCC35006 TaxID=2569542 RepID=UPI00142F07B7|nr:oligosaccharide flippase family protein [Desulfopila sp. IMCC35006]
MNFFLRLKYYLRAEPFEVNSQEGRTQERHRQMLLTTLSSGGAKILSIIITLAIVPLTLTYLGVERYGLWMTISSAVAMLGFSDLGVGSGLMNAVADAYGKNDSKDIKAKIAVGILFLSVIATLILLIFFIINPYVAWAQLLNVKSQIAVKEVAPTIAVIVVFFALSIPAGISLKIQMGLQMGFWANLWLAAGSIVGVAAVLCVIFLEGGLPYLAAASASPPVITGILAGIYFFSKQQPLLRPNFRSLKIKDAKDLGGTSGLFLVLQISGLIAFQSDNLIIAHYLGVGAVTVYAVAFKIFSLPTLMMSLFLNALWPAYAEANSRGDNKWIYNSFRKSIRYSVIIVLPLSLLLLVVGKWLIVKWVGESIVPTWDLLLGLFCWTVMTIFGGNFAVILNGLGIIRFQVITSVTMAAINIIVSIWLVQLIGVSGAVWGSVLSLVLIVYLPTALFLRNHFKYKLGLDIENNN